MIRTIGDVLHRTNRKTGVAEVGVSLANHPDRAWTSLEAFERITEQHGDGPWFLNDNGTHSYVRLVPRGQGQPKMVARLVAGEQPRRVVKYSDGDRLNLRPDNLVVCQGTGGLKRRAVGRAAPSANPSRGTPPTNAEARA